MSLSVRQNHYNLRNAHLEKVIEQWKPLVSNLPDSTATQELLPYIETEKMEFPKCT